MMKSLLQVLAYPFRKGPRRPLTLRRPAREKLGQNIVKPLGMESTDLKMFNRVARENNTLENAPLVIPGHLGVFAACSNTYVEPMPEDETYAVHYHRAYNKKDH
ncbi:MAG TPA: hypothetical protein DCE52_01385 [Rhodobacteraceae bacterium]|nr:hypothetical protein [Alphaproteobacteria bacterium]MCH9832659.1 hypothetical protein [Alphaproteobacteria bacterium]MDA9223839.1 hypothetical protein [Tateyamaria sp.]HAB36655.1 hypothetical protein [Paracoccaceae bacterium]